MAKKSEQQQIKPGMYDILRQPLVTEKSTQGSAHGQVTFLVPLTATKPEIKAAVEAVFSVKVKAVNTMIHKGKTKRFKGRIGFKSDRKKAIISLEAGQNLDVGNGV